MNKDLEAAINEVTQALQDRGVFVRDIGDGILNVHQEPITTEEADIATYLCTVTVGITE